MSANLLALSDNLFTLQQFMTDTAAQVQQCRLYQTVVEKIRTLADESAEDLIDLCNLLIRNTIDLTLQSSRTVGLSPDHRDSSPDTQASQASRVTSLPSAQPLKHQATTTSTPALSSLTLELSPTANPIGQHHSQTEELSPDQLPEQPYTYQANYVAITSTPCQLPRSAQYVQLLQTIGQEVRSARIQQNMCLDQLHQLTLVPIYHLRALETGQIEQLPELIYVRGFIQRIAKALNLDDDRWAVIIAEELANQWQRTSTLNKHSSSIYANFWSLYVAYAGLIAATTGGFVWATQQNPTPTLNTNYPSHVMETGKHTQASLATSLRSSSSVSRPEMLP